jgi:hypothetical protein
VRDHVGRRRESDCRQFPVEAALDPDLAVQRGDRPGQVVVLGVVEGVDLVVQRLVGGPGYGQVLPGQLPPLRAGQRRGRRAGRRC